MKYTPSKLQRFSRTSLLAGILMTCAVTAQENRVIDSSAGALRLTTFASGLEHPWGLAFLPSGAALVTERAGRLRLVSRNGQLSAPLHGVPAVFSEGQGGLLDIALDPNFSQNRWIYLSYAEPGAAGTAGTAVLRAKLRGGKALTNQRVIFRQQPKVAGPNHFGSRLIFARDGSLFITLGERFQFSPAQDLTSCLGKIVRIRPNGRVPRDNPFATATGAMRKIWSYGHRNVEGGAINPESGLLWTNELGPLGGDELNIPAAGQNYGWPLVSWGDQYSGEPIAKPNTRPDLQDAIYHWTPVISPSGMTFYTAGAFPTWRGNLFLAGLSAESLVRLKLDRNKVVNEERLAMQHRIRQVRQGPDGLLYLLTDADQGEILVLRPGP